MPAGSVAIGGAQTGIYPSELPGGWQLIGRTPLALFDAARDPPSLLAPGDRVRFVPIDAAEFDAVRGATRELAVLTPGLLTTLQDRGRRGCRISASAAPARWTTVALRLANALVGNAGDAAALEDHAARSAPALRTTRRLIALTGAEFDARLDGAALPMWRPLRIAAGAVLDIGRARAARAPISPSPAGSQPRRARQRVDRRQRAARRRATAGAVCATAIGLRQIEVATRRRGSAARDMVARSAAVVRCRSGAPIRLIRGAHFDALDAASRAALFDASSASARTRIASATASRARASRLSAPLRAGQRAGRRRHAAIAARRPADRADGRASDHRRLSAHRPDRRGRSAASGATPARRCRALRANRLDDAQTRYLERERELARLIEAIGERLGK